MLCLPAKNNPRGWEDLWIQILQLGFGAPRDDRFLQVFLHLRNLQTHEYREFT
jgi:hypothetical protein